MAKCLLACACILAISMSVAAQTKRVPGTDCALPFTLPPAVTDARIVMMGDMHGTHETPRMAAEIACTIARNGTPVTLAIEMPHDEQAALDAYLASDGGDAARSSLIARSFWRTRDDGLNTVATLGMIDRIRTLRYRGVPLAMLAIDAPSTAWTQPLPKVTLTAEQDQNLRAMVKGMAGNQAEQAIAELRSMLPGLIVRDRAMAQYMAEAIKADSARRFVVMAGNAHTNKLADGSLPGLQSMASLLLPQVKSLPVPLPQNLPFGGA
jgi:erythromycin esterase-like protein